MTTTTCPGAQGRRGRTPVEGPENTWTPRASAPWSKKRGTAGATSCAGLCHRRRRHRHGGGRGRRRAQSNPLPAEGGDPNILNLPAHTTGLGQGVATDGYGKPSKFEANVQRRA